MVSYRLQRFGDGLVDSKTVNLISKTKNELEHLEELKMTKYKHCWMKISVKHNSSLRINLESLNKKYPIAYISLSFYVQWERYKNTESGYHTNWPKHRKIAVSIFVIHFLFNIKEKVFCGKLWRVMRSGFIMKTRSEKKHTLTEDNRDHRNRNVALIHQR